MNEIHDPHATGSVVVKSFTVHEMEYRALLTHMQATLEKRIEADGASLFRTKIQSASAEYAVDPNVRVALNTGENIQHPVSLNMIYLASLTDEVQYHTCSCCSSFMKHYAGLVTIDELGATHSAFWDASTFPKDNFYYPVVKNIQATVERARVLGAHRAKDDSSVWGEFIKGNFEHFAVKVPQQLRRRPGAKTNRQVQAKLQEDYIRMAKMLSTSPLFAVDTLSQLMQMLNSKSVSGTEKIDGAGRWLYKLATERQVATDSTVKHNLLWREIAIAPAGWAHSKNNVVATVLQDLVNGTSVTALIAKYTKKVSGADYQRKKAPPAAGAVDAAEKLVEKLGIKESFRRRVAVFSDLPERAIAWKPSPAEAEKAKEAQGMFGHLKSQPATKYAAELNLPAVKMTWNKFVADVLPEVLSMEIYILMIKDFYTGFLTAAVPESPPILFHDHPEERNQFTDYSRFSNRNPITGALSGVPPQTWNLEPAKWYPVQAIVKDPNHWGPGEYPQTLEKLVFVIEEAYDTIPEREGLGLALFPADLKSELHEISRVVEAFSNAGRIEGDYKNQVVGLSIIRNDAFQSRHLRLKTTTGTREVFIDRWE